MTQEIERWTLPGRSRGGPARHGCSMPSPLSVEGNSGEGILRGGGGAGGLDGLAAGVHKKWRSLKIMNVFVFSRVIVLAEGLKNCFGGGWKFFYVRRPLLQSTLYLWGLFFFFFFLIFYSRIRVIWFFIKFILFWCFFVKSWRRKHDFLNWSLNGAHQAQINYLNYIEFHRYKVNRKLWLNSKVFYHTGILKFKDNIIP